MIITEYEPGDSTCYIMGLTDIPPKYPGTGRLGIYSDGGYILNVLNFGIVLIMAKGEYIDKGFVAEFVRNEWTVKAILSFLKQANLDLKVGE